MEFVPVKGSYVRNAAKDQGVVDSITKEGVFAYVRWFLNWDPALGTVQSYLEYVSISDLQKLPEGAMHGGLEALRFKILR